MFISVNVNSERVGFCFEKNVTQLTDDCKINPAFSLTKLSAMADLQ